MPEAVSPDFYRAPQPQSCPAGALARPQPLQPDDELVLPKPKRLVLERVDGASGPELHLHYRTSVIVFDEPDLIPFGEALALHPRFTAHSATSWGPGYSWAQVQEMLEALLAEGILHRATGAAQDAPPPSGPVPSPLPPASATLARTWDELPQISAQLCGRAVDFALLESIVPIHRVAHMGMDADGRQVGEANTYPPALRLDLPTEWRICHYAGSRYQHDHPMNVTALKTMIQHWKPMMVALARIRRAYLGRYPQAAARMSLTDIHRFATLVLAFPAYLLLRGKDPVRNGELHPVLSSLFRVSDGLRSTANAMLHVPIDGSVFLPSDPVTAEQIYAFAEHHGLFAGEHGICAGPRTLISEFLCVAVEGTATQGAESVVLDAAVQAALGALEPALEYGLLGARAYTIANSLLALNGGCSARLFQALEPVTDCAELAALRTRLAQERPRWELGTLWSDEQQRLRARVNSAVEAHAARGLGELEPQALSERLAPRRLPGDAGAELALRRLLAPRLAGTRAEPAPVLTALVDVLLEYLQRQRAIVTEACRIQERINALLGRPGPRPQTSAADLSVHIRLMNAGQLDPELRWPLLDDTLEQVLALRCAATCTRIEVSDGGTSSGTLE